MTFYLPVLFIMFLNVTDKTAINNHSIQTEKKSISTIGKKNILSHQVRIGIENKIRKRLANSLSDERQL